MRSYYIDEISNSDMDKIQAFLRKHATSSSLDQIFWMRIPDDLLNDIQRQHNGCQPHVFAVELGVDWVKFELFVRSLGNMRCSCPSYCTPQQRDFVIHSAHSMIENLGIKT